MRASTAGSATDGLLLLLRRLLRLLRLLCQVVAGAEGEATLDDDIGVAVEFEDEEEEEEEEELDEIVVRLRGVSQN